jgi:WD40 repeat protein
LYDVEADRTTRFKQTGAGPVTFLADGTPAQLVATKGGWPIRLVDLAKERTLRVLTLPEKERAPVRLLAMSPDAGTAASVHGKEGVEKHVVHVWDLKTGKPIRSLELASIVSAALSPDGAELAVGHADGRITLWDRKLEKPLSLPAGRLGVTALAFGRDPHRARTGRTWLLASGDAGGAVAVWDLSVPQVRTRCYGAVHHIDSLAFSPDGMTLATGGRMPIILWDLATGRRCSQGHRHTRSGVASCGVHRWVSSCLPQLCLAGAGSPHQPSLIGTWVAGPASKPLRSDVFPVEPTWW